MQTENDIIHDVAQVVRLHRKAAGLTQQGLGELAGVGKTVIFDIEQGKATVKLITLLKVLVVLNIKLQLLSPLIKE